jgi:hypothetical protein
MIVNNLSKLMTTLFFSVVMAIKEGEIFASSAGRLYDGAQWVEKTWKIADWVTMSLVALQTCVHQAKKSQRFVRSQAPRQLQMTQRHSTATWTTRRHKTRLKLTWCLTSLPMIINAKASSLTKVFLEGVAVDTDALPITIESGLLIANPTETLKEYSHE